MTELYIKQKIPDDDDIKGIPRPKLIRQTASVFCGYKIIEKMLSI